MQIHNKLSSAHGSEELAGILALGFFLAWSTLGWTHGEIVFGAVLTVSLTYHLCIQLSIALTFLVIALHRERFDKRPPYYWGAVCCLPACLSVLCVHASAWLGVGVLLIPGGILFGIAQGLFIYSWLTRHRRPTIELFIMMAWATGVAHFMHMTTEYFNSTALSLALPVISAWMLYMSNGHQTAPATGPAGHPAMKGASFARMAACLVVCGFSSGIAWFNSTGDPAHFHYVVSLLAFAAAVVVTMCVPLHENTLFAYLAIVSCTFVAGGLALPNAPDTLPHAAYTSFWLLETYAISWFAWHGAPTKDGQASRDCLGICAIYLLSGTANLAGSIATEQASYAIALALTACAFALAFANNALGTRREPGDPGLSSASEASTNPSSARVAQLAAAAGLTEAETSVFAHLAKGHSLKQVATTLSISESTAKFHRHNIYQKLGVSSRQELINLVETRVDTVSAS